MNHRSKKVTAYAIVEVTLEVIVSDTWPAHATVDEIQRNARASALQMLDQATERSRKFKVINKQSTKVVVTEVQE